MKTDLRPRYSACFRHCIRFSLQFFVAFGLLLTARPALAAAGAPVRSFDIPSGDALVTLRQFATQSGGQVLYAPEDVKGVTTRAVRGEFSPREALNSMLAGTELAVAKDEKSSALAIVRIAPAAVKDVGANQPQTAGASAPRADGDDVVELSPFVVESEQGWNATESISGTRFRSDLKDIPNQIETLTKEFMQDLAVNTAEDALIYSANSENYTEFMNSVNADNMNTFILGNTGRVRGMNSGTLSSNLFDSQLPTDNYNTDSVTVASGPSAILFGLGSPSGAFDSSPSRATMRNSTGVRLQVSSEDSVRASFDINRVIIPKALSIRLMGLTKNEQTFKKPNFDKDHRFTAAVTIVPFPTTTIRGWVETTDRRLNRAPRNLPQDNISLWANAATLFPSLYAPGGTLPANVVLDANGRPGYNNSVTLPANPALNSATRIFSQIANSGAPSFIFDPVTNLPVMGWGNSIVAANPSAAFALGVPDSEFDSGVNRTINDPSIFPFDVNVFGRLKETDIYGTTRRLFLEQKLTDNLFLEVAYNNEDARQQVTGTINGSQSAVFVDANLYLPVNLPGETTRRPNPNYGRYYINYVLGSSPSLSHSDDLRATLSYDLNLAQKGGRWGRWLGHHRFLAMGSQSERDARGQAATNMRILDNPVIAGTSLSLMTANNWATPTNRSMQVRAYFDAPYTSLPALPAGWEDGVEYVDSNGVAHSTVMGDSGFVHPVTGKRLATSTTVPNANLREVDSLLLAWQGQFLPDRERRNRLILTFGYRRDQVRTASRDTDTGRSDTGVGRPGFAVLLDDAGFAEFGPTQTGINRNYGVILRPWQWMSLSYSQSSTFDLTANFRSPYGDLYPGSAGEGKDYGIRFDLWKDKLSMRLSRYENSSGPDRASQRITGLKDQVLAIESRLQQLHPEMPLLNDGVGGYGTPNNAYAYPDYQVMSYKDASGYELSLNFTPTPNWNIRINGSEGEAIESQNGLDWLRWTAERLPVWQATSSWDTADINDANLNENRTPKQWYEQVVAGNYIAYMQGAEGRRTDNSRGRRANLITNYRFSEGRLRGFSIGGAFRWRPPATIGYAIKTNASGTKIFDVSRPFKGKTETPLDVFLGYRGRMEFWGGIRYNAQLNIRNVLNDRFLIPYRTYSDGTPVAFATQEPRLFILSIGFDL